MLLSEGERLSVCFPGLSLLIAPDGGGIVSGSIEVSKSIRYTIELLIPREYPQHEPIFFCNKKEIPWSIDRHVYETTGIACLCARSEIRVIWVWGSDLTDFVCKLVHPFLVGQFYYDTHGQWPSTGERSHGKQGILETFVDLLPEISNPTETQIRDFLRLLARKGRPKGHEWCPCGSGRRMRDCHQDIVQKLRTSVDPRHAKLDFEEAFGVVRSRM